MVYLKRKGGCCWGSKATVMKLLWIVLICYGSFARVAWVEENIFWRVGVFEGSRLLRPHLGAEGLSFVCVYSQRFWISVWRERIKPFDLEIDKTHFVIAWFLGCTWYTDICYKNIHNINKISWIVYNVFEYYYYTNKLVLIIFF